MIRWEVPPTQRLAFVGVLTLMVSALVVTVVADDFRPGGYLLALALGSAAVIRATMPEKYCLGLLVRSRGFDVATASALAVAVAVSTAIVPG